MEILFEDNTWVVDLITCSIREDNNNLIYSVEDYTIMDTYKSQLKYFIECLAENKLPMNNIKESAEILKICLINDN